MAAIDVDKYLEPISDEAPCGENLEYDSAFSDLERLARGKPEQEMGSSSKPAEEPSWREVFDAAEALLERSRDLRIVVYLTRAGLEIEGIRALASGVRLIHGLLQGFWDSVHPGLDEEDDNDPTARVNSLVALNDRFGMGRSLARAALVESRVAGRYSLRDIRLASGELTPGSEEEVPDAALIDAAFMDADIDALTKTAESVSECLSALDLIDALLRERVGTEAAPDLGNLKADLASIQSILGQQLQRRGVGEEPEAAGGTVVETSGGGGSVGQINSREDVVRVLDRLTEYFRKNEPSSPVPLLLQRAKRLVAKDFMEILKDLTPDGVSQAELIGGLDRDD